MTRNLGILVGGGGLIAGVAAVATGSGALGLLAGVLAIGAGAVGHLGAKQVIEENATLAAQMERRLAELEQARAEASDAREAATRNETALGQAQQTIAELSERVSTAGPDTPELEELEGSGTDTSRLTDAETGLFTEAYFRVALDARIASARRHLRPVAVALLDVAEGTGPSATERADPAMVTSSIRGTLRDADTASRLADGTFALILEDTPENGAVWTVERVRRNLVSRHGTHTMWAGVACYPAHAFSTEELLEQARVALSAAREWRQDRIEVAVAEV